MVIKFNQFKEEVIHMPKPKKSKKFKCPRCGAIVKFEDLEEVEDTRAGRGLVNA
jgi:hypothetical protein